MIQLACDSGLQGLSITDHDSVAAYQEASAAAQLKKISLIPGVEFSAVHQSKSVHLLAYSFSLNSPPIHALCQRHQQRRQTRNKKILELLSSHGMPLLFDDILPESPSDGLKHTIGRPHIALAMVKKGYVKTIQEAFHQYIGDGKPCYSPGETITVEETLEIIHQARGLAVIAHPHLIDDASTLRQLLEMNFDGIEGYYARFPPSVNERWLKIGARKGWIITGGSDFHGSIKPAIPLGSSWVSAETFSILQHHFQENEHIILQ
jgi:predicted metal-dependent phosphoesterase TrpH